MNQETTCTPKFPNEVQLSCVIALVQEIKANGLSVETTKSILWIAGSLLEKFKPSDVVSMMAMIEKEDPELHKLLVETKTFPWMELIPLIIQIIQLISKK